MLRLNFETKFIEPPRYEGNQFLSEEEQMVYLITMVAGIIISLFIFNRLQKS